MANGQDVLHPLNRDDEDGVTVAGQRQPLLLQPRLVVNVVAAVGSVSALIQTANGCPWPGEPRGHGDTGVGDDAGGGTDADEEDY